MQGRTYHQVEVDIVEAKTAQRAVDALFDALVPWVVELGGNPDLLTGHTRVLDSLADLLLVAVCKRRVDVTVAALKGSLDGFTDLARLGLPGSEADSRHLCAGVELRRVSLCTAVTSGGAARTVKLSLVQFLGAILARVRSINSGTDKVGGAGEGELDESEIF